MTDPAELSPETRVRIAESVYAREFGEEIVLLEFGRGEYFGLDPLGAEVWRGLERGAALGEIAHEIVARWDVAWDRALRDIQDLVSQMRDERLIEVEGRS